MGLEVAHVQRTSILKKPLSYNTKERTGTSTADVDRVKPSNGALDKLSYISQGESRTMECCGLPGNNTKDGYGLPLFLDLPLQLLRP